MDLWDFERQRHHTSTTPQRGSGRRMLGKGHATEDPLPQFRLLWFALLLCPSVCADATDLDRALAPARKDVLIAMSKVAKWAKQKRAGALQHDICTLMLEVDPDHKWARRVLGYKRRKGNWERKDYERPDNWNQQSADEGRAKLAEHLTLYKKRVLDALQAHPDTPEARVHALSEHLLDLLPNDPGLRAAQGYVEFEGAWVHPDTPRGVRRRRHLLEMAQTARAKAHETLVRSVKDEHPWPSAWASKQYTVVGSVEDEIVRTTCEWMVAANAICDEVYGTTKRRRGPRLCYLLTGRDEARKLVEETEAWRETLSKIDRFHGYHPAPDVQLSYRPKPEESRMACVRSVVRRGFSFAFGSTTRGWFRGGIGQRLCWYATGQHAPVYAKFDQTDTTRVKTTLPKDPTQWVPAAAKILEDHGTPAFVTVLTRRTNAMRTQDVLVAYGLAAYLIEARSDLFEAFVKASAKRHDADAFIPETTGARDVAAFVKRLLGWLRAYQ